MNRIGQGKSNRDQPTKCCYKCGFDQHRAGKCPAQGRDCYEGRGKDYFGSAPACLGRKPSKPKGSSKTEGDGKKKKKSKKDDAKSDGQGKKKTTKRRAICYLVQPRESSSSEGEEAEEEGDSDSETAGRILQEKRVGQWPVASHSTRRTAWWTFG